MLSVVFLSGRTKSSLNRLQYVRAAFGIATICRASLFLDTGPGAWRVRSLLPGERMGTRS
jgi:hypothetical protein